MPRWQMCARRLKIPHATVRNYYQGRLPAPEVLIKIANETSVSLNWLLTGTGDMYAGGRPPVGLGKFIEERIIETSMSGWRLWAWPGSEISARPIFVTNSTSRRPKRPWRSAESNERVVPVRGRECPQDYGVVFFRGWETFSPEDKIAAVREPNECSTGHCRTHKPARKQGRTIQCCELRPR